MAGSVFRPLTNIPYCCLPQESGPCLSTSVGDRPLRSPTHRRLGGPSPRQLSNGTHARPRPRRRLAPLGMPRPVRMAHYPAFPPAVRPSGVGCIRVTHPSATLMPPKGHLPFDLHVLGLPLAFILSQDQTLRCSIVFLKLSSESRVPPQCSLGVPSLKVPIPDAASQRRRSCAGLRLSKNLLPASPSLRPLFRSESGCKSTTFFRTGKHFFHLFFIFLLSL